MWKHDDTYYVVCGASKNGFAQARLYKSTDMFHWEFVNVLAESRGEWGYMWECPDFYPVGDKYVLMFSPMGGKERTSVYLVGDFDYDTGKFSIQFQGKLTGDLIIMHTVIPGTGWQKDSGRMGECMGLDAILERLGSDISRRLVRIL